MNHERSRVVRLDDHLRANPRSGRPRVMRFQRSRRGAADGVDDDLGTIRCGDSSRAEKLLSRRSRPGRAASVR